MKKLSLLLALALGITAPAGAQTLDRIRESGEIKIGFRTDAAPLSYADEDGNAGGYSLLVCIAVADAVSDYLEIDELNASFHPVTTENRFDKIANGEIDILCGATTITLARRELVDFSIPIYVDGSVVLLPRNGSPSFKALAGKRIGVRAGTTTADALKNTLTSSGIEAEEVPFESHDEGVLALRDGKIDAYFGDQSILTYQLVSKELGSDLRLTQDLMTVEKQGLAMARGDSEFRLVVDNAISTLYRTGVMQTLYVKALPGMTPGAAMRALHLTAPILP